MEVRGGVDRFEDADGGRERSIQGAKEVRGWNLGLQGEAGDLPERMNAGVGAARALGEDGFAGDVEEGAGERSLDCGKPGLHLPSMEGGAVVGEGKLPVRHGVLPEYRASGRFRLAQSGLI